MPWLIFLLLGGALYMGKENLAAAALSNSESFLRWDEALRAAAARYAIPDWRWLKAMMWQESALGTAKSVARGLAAPFDVEGSKSYDGLSWGLMQVTLRTARDMKPGVTAQELNDPFISIDLGARYFSQMLRRYKGDPERAVRAYNQGPGNEDNGKPFADIHLSRVKNFYAQIVAKQGV